MNKLFILCGLPFSGKTTLAKELVKRFGFTRIDLDEIKFELFGNQITDDEIDEKGWNLVFKLMYQRINEALDKGETVVHDTGNFTKEERSMVRHLDANTGSQAVTIFVDTPVSIARERLLINRITKERFDVTDADFEETITKLEVPGDDENTVIFDGITPLKQWLQQNIINTSIISVLHSNEVNWQDYRDLRLEALRLEPQAFGSSYNDQKNDSDDEWKLRFNRYIEGNGNWMVFAVENKNLIGMMGAFQAENNVRNNEAQIIAVYVKKDHRGKGVSKLLMSDLLKLLIQSNIKRVKLTVNADQKAAVSLYKCFGFTTINKERNKLGDSLHHDEHVMEKELA